MIAIYVLNRRDVDFEQLYRLHQPRAVVVIRATVNVAVGGSSPGLWTPLLRTN